MTAGLLNRFPEATVLTDGRLHCFCLVFPDHETAAGKAPGQNLGRGPAAMCLVPAGWSTGAGSGQSRLGGGCPTAGWAGIMSAVETARRSARLPLRSAATVFARRPVVLRRVGLALKQLELLGGWLFQAAHAQAEQP
jgi:hypothetical protein